MFIPDHLHQTEKKYALGKYVIHPAHENNDSLENWIKNIQFKDNEISSNRMTQHSRKRNNLYTFHLNAINKEVVLKVSQISNHYSWHRKFNLMLVDLLKNYSLNAYYGGIALEKIHVESIKVVAHWTCKRQSESKKSYLLYEKVESGMSVHDLCEKIVEDNPNPQPVITSIAKSLAKIIRILHKNNIRHGDPHPGNFLVCSSVPEIKQITPESVQSMTFTLIDLDKIHYANKENSWKKKLYNLRCIRRFYVHDIDSKKCLEYYLDKKPSIVEQLILKFWMGGGFNLYKWLKPTKKRI